MHDLGDSITEDYRQLPILPDDLNDKHRAAIEMLVLGRSIAATSRSLEVTPKTLYNWRQMESFRIALERRRRELWDDASERLRGMIHSSLDIVEQHLADRYDRSRFRAAATVLRLSKLGNTVPLDES